MPLGVGERLGPYEIVGLIGSGGMGEVYQARDTRLARDVAIKVVGAQFGERFRREARAIAALNHPNVCTLYDVGPSHLVMELVPGPTLAEVIAATRTPGGMGLPLADVLVIARQIAEALEAAHEKGIIHRDLKPANVKVTPDGIVKVLDFGLAKALAPEEVTGAFDANVPTVVSNTPSEHGLIVGTLPYMAPEQAQGRPVDRRADIWAFGVVLFEMLTGRRLFQGETAADVIAAVIKGDTALDRLPPDVPPAIRRLLARCLDRDPRQRLRDIGEARIVLADPASIATRAFAESPETPARSRASARGWAAIALVLAAAAGAAAAAWWLEGRTDQPLRRIDLAGLLASSNGVALAPDGSRIAYVRDAHLYVRDLDGLAPQDLGVVHVTSRLPFWSPDGHTIGYVAGGAIHTIPADGGPTRQVCRIPTTGNVLDVVWQPDGTMLLAVARAGLYRVPAAGGTPTVHLPIDAATELEFTSVSPLSDNRLIVTTRLREPLSFRTELVESGPERRRTTIIADPDVTFVKYAPHGALLYRRRGPNDGVWAVPFDEGPVDLAGAVELAPRGTRFQADATGSVLIHLPPPAAFGELVWLSQTGEVSRVPGAAVDVGSGPVLSPDGRRVAFVVGTEDDWHLVVRDLTTGSDTRLTPAGEHQPTLASPAWFPSSDEVVFATGPVTARQIVARRIDGAGGQRLLVNGLVGQVTPDGRYLVFLVEEGAGARRLRYAPFAGDGTVGAPARLFGEPDPDVGSFDLSPDGSVVAYNVREADSRLNIFLTDFPAGSRQLQITTRGGGFPLFSGDGTALFYLAPLVPRTDPPQFALAKTPLALPSLEPSGPPIQILAESELPPGVMVNTFDVARDGRMLAMRRVGDQRPSPRLVLVQNWRAALPR